MMGKDFESQEINFQKSFFGGGTNKLKSMEKIEKIGNWGPPTIRDGRVH